MVQEVRYFLSTSFSQGTFDSCRNVVHPSTSGSILSLMCGRWGETLCTASRWFDFLGSTSNGMSPFDILYEYVDEEAGDLGGFVAHNPSTVPCDQASEVTYAQKLCRFCLCLYFSSYISKHCFTLIQFFEHPYFFQQDLY